MAIPKIIHYCWLSENPVPEDMLRYMATWKEHLSDYEFIKWDFNRFDINSSVWVKEAFENKKYAFAADYIRMYALYTMGGIYLDMDVEVLKPYDDLLDLDYFLCFENSNSDIPEVASFGAKKGCKWVGYVLDYYNGKHFVKEDGTFQCEPLPNVTKSILIKNGLSLQVAESLNNSEDKDNGILLFPCDYFSPKSYLTGKISITKNTYSIHQFKGSWIPWEQKLEMKFWTKLRLKPHRVMWHLDKWLDMLFGIKR